MPACCLSPLRAVMKSCTLTGSSMEQGHAPALPVVWAQVLLLLYVTPPVCYSSCSRPAGDVVWIQQCLAQLFQQRQHFLHGSSHYSDRRPEEKPGAAGSGLGDLVGGIFPPS